MVRYMVDTILRKILIDRDVAGSIEFTKGMIKDLLQNNIDLSLLIVTKQLKPNYTNLQPHAVLAERMRKRDPATAPNVGDRVPYVIVRGDKGTFERDLWFGLNPASIIGKETFPFSEAVVTPVSSTFASITSFLTLSIKTLRPRRRPSLRVGEWYCHRLAILCEQPARKTAEEDFRCHYGQHGHVVYGVNVIQIISHSMRRTVANN